MVVPLRQQGELIGTLTARRIEVHPFTPAQIKLLETFADQAVIAIENVRLFQELKESLEQQTATSEILGVIASSPTDIQPVLDVVAENAARVCDAEDAIIRLVEGNCLYLRAHRGSIPSFSKRMARCAMISEFLKSLKSTNYRWSVAADGFCRAMIDRQTIHIHDIAAVRRRVSRRPRPKPDERESVQCYATPLLREGVAIGVILIRRMEVRPFTDKQI